MILIAAIVSSVVLGQAAPPAPECGTQIPKNEVAALLKQHAVGAYGVSQPLPSFVFSVPVRVHIIRRSNSTGGIEQASVDLSLAQASNRYRPAGFVLSRAALDFIDSDALFDVQNAAEFSQVLGTNNDGNMLNIYYVNSLSDDNGSYCGRATFTTSPGPHGALVVNQCALDTTLDHEVGHYFDLYHTHETAHGMECPDGSNCGRAGDLLCDTPADPRLSGRVNWFDCTYSPGTNPPTACGQPYSPNTHNIMSYTYRPCSETFTPGQWSRAFATLINLRPNLLGIQLGDAGHAIIWGRPAAFPNGIGSYGSPFSNLASMLGAVSAGGTVVLTAGTYSPNGPITIFQPVTLDSFFGPATLSPVN